MADRGPWVDPQLPLFLAALFAMHLKASVTPMHHNLADAPRRSWIHHHSVPPSRNLGMMHGRHTVLGAEDTHGVVRGTPLLTDRRRGRASLSTSSSSYSFFLCIFIVIYTVVGTRERSRVHTGSLLYLRTCLSSSNYALSS